MLEFGHGLAHSNDFTLYRRGEKMEFWAVEDYQALYYYPNEPEWLKAYTAFVARYPQVKFVRALLGSRERTRSLIPENHFDLVFSVSALMEKHSSCSVAVQNGFQLTVNTSVDTELSVPVDWCSLVFIRGF